MNELEILKNNNYGLIEPEDALNDGWIPDQLFSSGNDWEIPDLLEDMQATEAAIPFLCYGEQARSLNLMGNGTLHFYTDDYRWSSIWEHPEKVQKHNPRNIIEPNFSLYLDMAPAFGLQAVYKKRVVARMMQDRGIRVFVDLNVAQKFIKLNLIGVPNGWRAFATRGYSDRLPGLELEYRIAETSASFAGRKPLFVVYGGGAKCKDFCKEVGAIYITPNIVLKNKEKAFEQLMKDNVIAFTDEDFSLQALEEGKNSVRANQAIDYMNNKQLTN
jgi:hypothetical protein